MDIQQLKKHILKTTWKEAIDQLTCYNTVDPKEKLEMYMFGKYKQSCKDEAIKVTTSCKKMVMQLF